MLATISIAVIDQSMGDADAVLIVRHDAPNAVIMLQAHFNSHMETLHPLSSLASVARSWPAQSGNCSRTARGLAKLIRR
ncbi:type II toxin-antitoxin system Phd/YefM family antitoxin [Cupriavidus basilensis]|uniref:type II toxin-antitoxin system Phd/YefM family antitoxin n=1 Tax=Cupriavidus basilensis TaxID=68895 RepID=UPI001C2D950E|nr:type II toxin-antitoxin system Phd/YefM family antitoxin [Cupriavidus basilensis]